MRWAEGSHGRWAYRLATSRSLVSAGLASAARELAEPPRAGWRVALSRFAEKIRAAYGSRLHSVVLYGSRARGDVDVESDVDVLVVLDPWDDTRGERDRVWAIACRVMVDHDCVISALPVSRQGFQESTLPILVNARREGKVVAGKIPV